MTGPSGNSELKVSGKQNSLFLLGPVIKCFSKTPSNFHIFGCRLALADHVLKLNFDTIIGPHGILEATPLAMAFLEVKFYYILFVNSIFRLNICRTVEALLATTLVSDQL